MSYDVDSVREREFPWTLRGEVTYLNHAGTGPLPRRTVETLHEWNSRRMEPWQLPDHTAVFPAMQRTRELCAALVGALPAEIALVSNTSTGISLAARALPLAPGDVVLTYDGEFRSVIYAWTAIGRSRGVELQRIPMSGGVADEAALLHALDGPRVRAVIVSWVAFATGYRTDLTALGQACRDRGIYFVVDAIQGLGPATLDVHACNADVLACGAQKWLLGPWGAGFVYVREALIQRLEPPVVGWLAGPRDEDYSRQLDYDLMAYYPNARRFEVMTMATQDYVGMGRSIELLLELGPAAVEAHVRGLVDHIVAWAIDRADMRLVTPLDPAKRAGIVAIAPPDPGEASRRLTEARIIDSVREGAIRFSPYVYNTVAEVDAALSLLGGLRGRC